MVFLTGTGLIPKLSRMLRIIWVLFMSAGALIAGAKTVEAITVGCVTILRRAGALRACPDNEPLIYFGMLLFWLLCTLAFLFAAYRSIRRQRSE